MLILKKHHSLRLPHLPHVIHPLILSPVRLESDELIQSINDNSNLHDNNWVLSNAPDVMGLDQFWQGVERDIQNDPEWIRFSDE